MNALLTLPDWAPAWLGPVLFIFGALFALAFLLMPFTVFSLKSRLEQIEMKIDELHADLRAVAPAEPIAPRRAAQSWVEPTPAPQPQHYAPPPPPAYAPAPVFSQPQPSGHYPVHPPIAPRAEPPRQEQPVRAEPPPYREPYRDEPRPQRAEPKLNWPR
jgi:hypothetical protein